ncbi:MAG TPA: hypothetical protein EYP98_04325 [Planctomycetes bacterium]|nr:hypothetical protein [Planctomycetota bacterium]
MQIAHVVACDVARVRVWHRDSADEDGGGNCDGDDGAPFSGAAQTRSERHQLLGFQHREREQRQQQHAHEREDEVVGR